MSFRRNSLLVFLLLLPLSAAALHSLGLQLERIEGPGLKAEDLSVEFVFNADGGLALNARGGRLELSDLAQALKGFELHCGRFESDGVDLSCGGGRLKIGHPWLDRPDLSLTAEWRGADQRLELLLQRVRFAGGSWQLEVVGSGKMRHVTVTAKNVDLAALQRRLMAEGLLPASDMALSGQADIRLKAGFSGEKLQSIKGSINGVLEEFSALEANYLAEGLGFSLGLDINSGKAGQLTGEVEIGLKDGALLTPFVYLEPGDGVELSSGLRWQPAKEDLSLAGLNYRHEGILLAQADIGLNLSEQPELTHLRLKTERIQAQALYESYFQPLLSTGLLANVAWQGGFELQADKPAGSDLTLSANFYELGLRDVPVTEASPRFQLSGLEGEVHWHEKAGAPGSRLVWKQAQLLGTLDIGAAGLRAELNGRRFSLSKVLQLPVLDGSLLVDRLDLALGEEGDPQLDFDAVLTPITLGDLSQAFGWLPLSGSVSGVLPGLSLRQGELTLAGNLLVRVFDGDILIRDLRLSDVFGSLPLMQAEIDVNRLDLNELTRAFSFGKITGRLDGRLHGLRLEAWRPVAFDARFFTPEDDESDHSISQKAVDNISNLGGAGITGALSRSFLGIFENFGYDRLGIGCVLRQGVCRMSGIKPAEQGYYLVIGSGIPQINIKGFNQQADWQRLVQQLKDISAGGAPTVE